MDNCFVTKFKAVVDNDNLPIFETIVLDIKSVESPTSSNRRLSLKGSGLIVKTEDGSNKISTSDDFSNPQSSVTLGSDVTNLFLVNGDYKLHIGGKYDLERAIMIVDQTVDINEFAYSKKLTNLVSHSSFTKGDIISLNNLERLTEVALDGPDFNNKNAISGDVGELKLPDSCTTLTVRYSNVSGNIETLDAKGLTLLTFDGTTISGDLKTWALRQWNNGAGRTSGQCVVVVNDGQGHVAPVTWDGQSIPEAVGASNLKVVFSASGVTATTP